MYFLQSEDSSVTPTRGYDKVIQLPDSTLSTRLVTDLQGPRDLSLLLLASYRARTFGVSSTQVYVHCSIPTLPNWTKRLSSRLSSLQ